jgi:hypothetical protein
MHVGVDRRFDGHQSGLFSFFSLFSQLLALFWRHNLVWAPMYLQHRFPDGRQDQVGVLMKKIAYIRCRFRRICAIGQGYLPKLARGTYLVGAA